MAYPNTDLAAGTLDAAFGGQTANAFGAQMRAFIDAQIRECERQIIDDQWRPWRFVRVKSHNACLAGDCLFFDLAGSEADYTVSTLAGLSGGAFSAAVHKFSGVAAEAASAGQTVRMILSGVGISPAITALASGASSALKVNTTTGRLAVTNNPGDAIVGYVNDKGFATLRGDMSDAVVP